jgi:hypothetical protein
MNSPLPDVSHQNTIFINAQNPENKFPGIPAFPESAVNQL